MHATLLLSVSLALLGQPPASPTTPEEWSRQAARLGAEAQQLRQEGRNLEALGRLLRQREALLQLPEESPELPELLGAIADLYEQFAQWPDAEACREDAIRRLARRLPADAWQLADARRALQTHRQRAAFTDGQQLLWARVGQLDRAATALRNQGRFGEAVAAASLALCIRGELLGPGHSTQGVRLNNLAELHRNAGDYAAAAPLYAQAREQLRQSVGERHPLYATVLNNAAENCRFAGDYAGAEPLFAEARDRFRDLRGERDPATLTVLINLATLYRDTGEFGRAEALYRQAEAGYRAAAPRSREYAAVLNNLGVVLTNLQRLDEAERLHRQALQLRRELFTPDHPEVAISLHNLAEVLRRRGDLAAARGLAAEALELRRSQLGPRHPFTAASLHQLGAIAAEARDYPAAEERLREALAITRAALGESHPQHIRSLTNLAGLLAVSDRPAQAAPLYREAVDRTADLLDRTAVAQSEAGQLNFLRVTRGALDQLLWVTRADPDAGTYAAALRYRGMVTARQRAQRALADTLPALAGEREALRQVTRQLAQLALAQPDPRKVDLAARTAELTEQLDLLQRRLASDPAWRAAQQAGRLDPDQLRARLPADAALVDFLCYRDRLTAFVLTPRRIHRVELGEAAPIEAAVARFRERLDRTEPDSGDDEPGQVLRRLLWLPLQPHLGDAATVLLCPDGALTRLPFAALPGRAPGRFLLEELTLLTLPAPQFLLRPARPRGDAPVSLLAVGGVEFGPAERATGGGASRVVWPALPASGREVDSIAALLQRRDPAARVRKLAGGDADEGAFRAAAPGATYLHLATHGFFAAPSPAEAPQPDGRALFSALFQSESQRELVGRHPGLLSGLVLAGIHRPATPGDAGAAGDGLLTALEIAEMDLSGTELVVLSACETGLGVTAGGEGVLGLQRAFQLAGARHVVCSLWKVSDAGTAALMSHFYENLWARGLPPAAALRQAQRLLLDHPELEGEYARQRGPVFTPVPLPATAPDAPEKGPRRAPIRIWAAFTLAGGGG